MNNSSYHDVLNQFPEIKGEGRPQIPIISIVVPVFNEEEALPIFIENVDVVANQYLLRVQYLFVDDGSNDGTLAHLHKLQSQRDDIDVVALSRNFGKEAALTAGLDYANGDVVIPMDVDLQDPPELIPEFLKHWNRGYDVVYGVRVDREHDTPLKRLTARAFYKAFNAISHVRIPADAGDFRLMDARVVQTLRELPERNRFMKGLFAWVGFLSVSVPYTRPERSAGKTKFSFIKLWNFAIDGLASFSTAPLKLSTYIGSLTAIFASIYAFYVFGKTILLGVDAPGYASLMVVLLMSTAIQLIILGVIGEYLSRLMLEAKGRPIYVLREASIRER